MTGPADAAVPHPGDRAAYERAARAWARHVGGAGTTPWSEFRSTSPAVRPSPGEAPTGTHLAPRGELPAAEQLELVRRLAVRAGGWHSTADGGAFAALADRVLGRPAPGRGTADRPLAWPDDPRVAGGRWGAPPVDPALLGAGELLRLGAGVVADLLAASRFRAGSGEATESPPRPAFARLRGWSRVRPGPAYRVVGAATAAAGVRAALAEAGHPGTGRLAGGPVLVVVDSLGALLGDAWAMRVRQGSRTRWRTFVGALAARDELPASAALDRVAASWAERVGRPRVHVVVGPAPAGVAAVLGVRAPKAVAAPAGAPLSPIPTDVVRRVNAVLRMHEPPESHRVLAGRLAGVLATGTSAHAALRVPDRHRDWAVTAGDRLARRLAEGGYPVHGDLGGLRRPGTGPSVPPPQAVLEGMLDAVLVLAGVVPAGTPPPQGGRR